MKHLPKHLRPRYRYLAVALEGWPGAAVDRAAFERATEEAARALVGDVGAAALDLSVLSFAFADAEGTAVVRCRRGETERARAALSCVDAVDGQPLGVRVTGVSGTVRACEEKYIRRPRESTDERTVAFADAERAAVSRGDRLDVRLPDGYVGATGLDT